MSDNSAGNRRFIYDAAGQLVTAVDALGYRTHFEYDAAGQMVRTRGCDRPGHHVYL